MIVGLAVMLLAACGGREEAAAPGETNSGGAKPDAVNAGAPEAASEQPKTALFHDAQGHEVLAPAQPQRIFAPYLEDTLLALGVKPVAQWSLGKTVQDYLQPQLKDIPTIDCGGGCKPEAILSHNPDLMILAANMIQGNAYESYSQIAPAYVFDSGMTNWREKLKTIGRLVGRSEAAEQALQAYERKAEQAKEAIRQATEGKTVAILWIIPKQYWLLADRQYAADVLYGDLGLTPPKLVLDTASGGHAAVSLEMLPELNADYIFLIPTNASGNTDPRTLLDSAIWKGLPAVKQGHVFEVGFGHWINSGLLANGRVIDDVVQSLSGMKDKP